jgi:hypothetical protein
MQALHCEWHEFEILGKAKQLSEVLELALANNEHF